MTHHTHTQTIWYMIWPITHTHTIWYMIWPITHTNKQFYMWYDPSHTQTNNLTCDMNHHTHTHNLIYDMIHHTHKQTIWYVIWPITHTHKQFDMWYDPSHTHTSNLIYDMTHHTHTQTIFKRTTATAIGTNVDLRVMLTTNPVNDQCTRRHYAHTCVCSVTCVTVFIHVWMNTATHMTCNMDMLSTA